eukprot:12694660-Ditylum_brightwellii.AAC.1
MEDLGVKAVELSGPFIIEVACVPTSELVLMLILPAIILSLDALSPPGGCDLLLIPSYSAPLIKVNPTCPCNNPATTNLASGVYLAAVIISGACAQSLTLPSKIDHTRSFLSDPPERKYPSQPGRETCHNRTVLSSDADRRKFVALQEKSITCSV